MIAIAFALPDESRDFVALLRHAGRDGEALLGNLGAREVAVVHTGMGGARVCERLPRALEGRPVEALISAGYAGGLDPSLPAGALLLGENGSDPALVRFALETLGCRAGRLVTATAAVESAAAKAALRRETGGDAVEMETQGIAAFCRARGLPLLSLRVISDPAGEELAVPFSVCFDAERERPRVGALLGYLARHPSRIGGFARFAGRVGRARAGLAQALAALVAGWPTGSPAAGAAPIHPGR